MTAPVLSSQSLPVGAQLAVLVAWDDSLNAGAGGFALVKGSSGAVSTGATIATGDIEIGAVELKDGATNNRAVIDASGNVSVTAVALGALADSAVTDPAISGSMIALLKGIISKLAGLLTVSITGNNAITITDRSGTITTGGTAQQLMASSSARKGWVVQNTSDTDMWVSTVGTAAVGGSSMKLVAGALYESPLNMIPVGAISIFCATTGKTFMAQEAT